MMFRVLLWGAPSNVEFYCQITRLKNKTLGEKSQKYIGKHDGLKVDFFFVWTKIKNVLIIVYG